jgi:hypothetical protein
LSGSESESKNAIDLGMTSASAASEAKGSSNEEQPRVYSVSEVCNKSKHTARTYRIAFEDFFRSAKIDNFKTLLDLKPSVVEAKIIDHVNYLKDERRLSYAAAWSIYLLFSCGWK